MEMVVVGLAMVAVVAMVVVVVVVVVVLVAARQAHLRAAAHLCKPAAPCPACPG